MPATGVEPLGVLPELEEDLLDQLLGQRPVAQDPHREAEGGVAVAAVHLGQRRLPEPGDGDDQRGVARLAEIGVHHCTRVRSRPGALDRGWRNLPSVVELRPNSGGTRRMSTHRPMEGIRILDLADHTFVPAASAILSDWGAEVIKIEHITRGDAARGLASTGMAIFAGDVSPILEHANRGKLSLALDLNQDEGRDILYQLAAISDVFLTNKMPSVREKLKTDVDDIRAAQPEHHLRVGARLRRPRSRPRRRRLRRDLGSGTAAPAA